MDTLGIEPITFRMRSGCNTTTPCALDCNLQKTCTHVFVTILSPPNAISGRRILCTASHAHTNTRHQGDPNTRGQSPMDFESISLATQTQRHKDRGNTDQFAIIAPCLPGACNLEVNSSAV